MRNKLKTMIVSQTYTYFCRYFFVVLAELVAPFLRILLEQHLLYFWYVLPFLLFAWLLTSCLSNFFIYCQIYERFLSLSNNFILQILKRPLKLCRESWFWQKQNNLVGQLKRFEIIVRHSLEISVRMTSWPPILPYYHEQRLWIPLSLSGISDPRPGLTPGTALRAVGSGTNVTVQPWGFQDWRWYRPVWTPEPASCFNNKCKWTYLTALGNASNNVF